MSIVRSILVTVTAAGLAASEPARAQTVVSADTLGGAVPGLPTMLLGTRLRLPIGSGNAVERVGKFLFWSADTLFFEATDGDTVAVPDAVRSRLLVQRTRDYRWQMGLVGTAAGALIGGLMHEPRYGYGSIGEALGCAWTEAFGGSCPPPPQINSRAGDAARGAALGAGIGFLLGRAVNLVHWERMDGTRVVTEPGSNGTTVGLSIPMR
jgi:hypothetical protein